MWFRWPIRRRREKPPPTVRVLNRDELMAMGVAIRLTREQLKNGCTITFSR